MENLEIYNKLSQTPAEARKTIGAGRLKGFTDINPMWRIKRMTEVFGPYGQGWYYIPRKREMVPGAAGEIACFVDIDLFYKMSNGEWSEAVPGTGGSMFVANERNGIHTSDEAVKMATTDAIGSACKLLGMSSDIYFEKDRTKYTATAPETKEKPHKCSKCGKDIIGVHFKSGKSYTAEELIANSQKYFGAEMCYECIQEATKVK